MMIGPPPRVGVIICDDLPEAYVRLLYGNRIDHDTIVFSRGDAVRAAEAERRRITHPKQHPLTVARIAGVATELESRNDPFPEG